MIENKGLCLAFLRTMVTKAQYLPIIRPVQSTAFLFLVSCFLINYLGIGGKNKIYTKMATDCLNLTINFRQCLDNIACSLGRQILSLSDHGPWVISKAGNGMNWWITYDTALKH